MKKRYKHKIKTQKGQLVFDYFIMTVVVVISLFPFLWVLMSSFKTNQQILTSSFSLPTSFYIEGYQIAMEKVNILARFFTSIVIAIASTGIGVVIYSMAGYVLACFEFKGKGVIFALLISSMLIPSNAMIQPIFFIINTLGLYDTKTALIVVYTGFGMATSLFLMRNFFASVPKELMESARIDGAGFFRIFRSVMLPLSKPAMSSAAILMFINNFNEFMYALLLTSSEKNRTLPLTIKYFTSTFNFNYSSMFAALVLCVLPTVIVYLFLQEQIAESMVAGSIKG